MSMFKQRRQRDIPQLNMASMPDLIFTVLFFFMIVTHMRSVPVMVKHQVPAGKELTKLSKQPVITYIYIGKPLGGAAADSPSSVVQVNDKIMEVDAISDYMSSLRHSLGKEDAENMIVSLKVDKDTEMGLVSDVKQALRRAHVTRVHYSAVSKDKNL
ncbi:MAG: biopolymer transporter ExbD [Prevotella sp.]|nr:biopolymer transporter ExbD [Prevotella sp.]MBQ6032962.1 biopolymer transporter ExbD [Prevotella sp.]MBQ7717550.1 biopolymer transporter ExbD [Prevotella sp.]MBR0523661.1 biopolymer transporter ExbD [Prevotella sp.]